MQLYFRLLLLSSQKISHLLIQARFGVSCTTFIKCVTFQTMTYD